MKSKDLNSKDNVFKRKAINSRQFIACSFFLKFNLEYASIYAVLLRNSCVFSILVRQKFPKRRHVPNIKVSVTPIRVPLAKRHIHQLNET